MTGLQKCLKVPTKNFERWLKRVLKLYKSNSDKQVFQRFISQLTDSLCIDPRPSKSALELLPGKISLPPSCEFRKLSFAMPGRQGASGEGRLMYLVNLAEYKLVLVWIYTHREFEGRPDDKSLRSALKDAINAVAEDTDFTANIEEEPDSNDGGFSDPI